MSTLDVSYYNRKVSMINQQAELSACIFDFYNILDQAFKQEFLSSSSEELERGDFSVGHMIVNFIKAIVNMAKWLFKTLKNMALFMLRGFTGTMGRSLRQINKVATRIPHMQNSKLKKGFNITALQAIKAVMESHAENEGFKDDKLPQGNINNAKEYFIQKFNHSQKPQAQIDKSFIMMNPPVYSKGETISKLGYNNAEILRDGYNLVIESRKIAKTRLKELMSESRRVKEIVKNIEEHGYKQKYARKAETTEVLLAAFHGAVLAFDLKYLQKSEQVWIDMIDDIYKQARDVVADNDADEESGSSSPSGGPTPAPAP